MKWFFNAIMNKYAKFDGRARRKEYWIFNFFYYLILLVVFIGVEIFSDTGEIKGLPSFGLLIFIICTLGLSIPMWAVTFRRLHDSGKSGWWVWICLIPYIGPFILFLLCCLNSEPGINKYGSNPKGIEAKTVQL